MLYLNWLTFNYFLLLTRKLLTTFALFSFFSMMASGILKVAMKPSSLRSSETILSRNAGLLWAGSNSLHTSPSRNELGSWKIPERLQHIPDAEDPSFFNMVEYYFHKACVLGEPRFMQLMKRMRISEEEKRKKVHGILKIIEPCAHVLEVNIPLLKDDGTYEMITGYRAQHSHHRYVADEVNTRITG